MRNVTRWLLVCVLVIPALVGCDLVPTPSPVPVAEPAPPTVAEAATSQPGATCLPPITATPAIAAPTAANPTASPQPAALTEPAIVDAWQLWEGATPGHDPALIATVDDTVLVVNVETDNVTLIRKEQIVDVVPLVLPGFENHDLDFTSIVADQTKHCAYIAAHVAFYDEQIGAIIRVATDGTMSYWPKLGHIQHIALVDGKIAYQFYDWGTITLLDPATGDMVGEVDTGDELPIRGMCGDPTEPRLYVVDKEDVASFDSITGAKLASATLAGRVTDIQLATDGSRLYVSTFDPYAVSALDTETLATVASVEMENTPSELAVSATTGHVAVRLDYGSSVRVLDQNLAIVWDLPFDSVRCMAYGERGVLYLADWQLDTVTVFDPVRSSMPPIIPLSAQLGGLAVDPINSQVLVSLANQDQVLVLNQDGSEQRRWMTGSEPGALTVWPSQAQVAVVEKGDDTVTLYDQQGAPVMRYGLHTLSDGVMIDPVNQTLVAGDQRIDTRSAITQSMHVETYLGMSVVPVKTLMDTRRQRIYGIVSNGTPGSNGGNHVRLLDAPEGSVGPDQIAYRHVHDAVYDEEHDQFLVGWGHMGNNALLVYDAETGQLVYELDLGEHYVTSMVLNPVSRHVWLATEDYPMFAETETHKLFGYDTRTLARIYDAEIDTRIDHMAVDPNAMRVYMATDEAGAILLLQDMVDRDAAPPPGPPTVTPFPTYEAVPTLPPPPTSTPAVTPCALQAHPVIALVAPVDTSGCPVNEGASTNLAIQPFEHGRMIWREDTTEVMVLLDSGILVRVDDTWQEGMPDQPCDAGPVPEGLWQPIRGFGLAWCDVPGLRDDIGWAKEPESGASGFAQRFEVGEFLHIDGSETLFLGNQGAWRTVGDD